MQKELQLDILPDCSQRATVVEISTRLWQHDDVVALWLGGSLARGAWDEFSDIDFRVAVAPQDILAWKTPPFEEIFAHAPVVGQQFLVFGEQAFLHHLVLANGEIIDFFVLSTRQKLTPEPRLILGCRDEDFAQLLVANQRVARVEQPLAEVEPATIQDVLTSFWINTHKHCKVLHRNLDLLVNFGFDVEKALLVRLWYIEVSGKDCGDVRQGTIHTLTSIMRTLEQAVGDEARSVMGAPMRTRAEIGQAIEGNRKIVSRIGRHLAQKYGFVYPDDLEATVLQSWQEFLELQ
jgi:predicted nucleotidyltransferase